MIFDAILVKRCERAPLVAEARSHGAKAVAVWFHTPLSVCIERNAARPADEVADERGLRNVYAAVEPPTQEEGFADVLHVEHVLPSPSIARTSSGKLRLPAVAAHVKR